MDDAEIRQIYTDLRHFMKSLKKSNPVLYEQLASILNRLREALEGVLDEHLQKLFLPWGI